MTIPPHETPSEDQINSYLDDELSPEARLLVEEAISHDAELRERLELDAAINKGLHALFDDTLDAPLPARLVNTIGPADSTLQERQPRPGRKGAPTEEDTTIRIRSPSTCSRTSARGARACFTTFEQSSRTDW